MILLYTTIALIPLILINVPIAVAIGVTSLARVRLERTVRPEPTSTVSVGSMTGSMSAPMCPSSSDE